ncbi:TolC family protein [Lutibacter maritimus]|uniref:Outer membrane protein n=1 Tax=Lutibacter maritimus TaxID=593133 RepID=A0A1I6RKF2_9FLAO|nr:TolC family protein [Lutibacter maritimus]SFS65126.1 outer membrane protein [Lutibacter maritimus]
MRTKILSLIAFIFFITLNAQDKKWTLQECVNYAIDNNITIKQNQLNVEISQENLNSAKGNFLPNLNASTSGNLNFGSGFDPVSQDRVSTSTFGGSFGINSGITVFNGYRNLNTYKQAKLGVESSKLDLEKIQDDISLYVVNTYLNVLFAKENLNVAKVQYEISNKQIENARAKFEAGVKPKGDLLNAQSTAAADEQAVIAYENTLNLALLDLAQLLQISPVGFDVEIIQVDSPSIAMLYNNPEDVYQKALTNRPEIKRAELDIESADLSVEIAKASFLPSVSFGANIGTGYGYNLKNNSHIPYFTQLDNNLGYGLNFNVNIPIFNRNQTKSNVNRQKINYEISKFGLENQKLQLQQTIQKAYYDAKAAAKTFESAQKSLLAQNEAFKNAQESYNVGAMTQFDFDLVRNRLVSAEGAIIRAKYDYIFKTKVLKFYYGESITLN